MQMDVWALVACEADVANLASLSRLQDGFHRAPFRKNAVGIGVANYFVELEEIDPVGLKAAQRLVDLACSGGFGAPVDLGHKKRFLAIAVAQRVTHADFTLATVVVPAVVKKMDAAANPRNPRREMMEFAGP